MRIDRKIYRRSRNRINTVILRHKETVLTVFCPNAVRRYSALSVKISFHLGLDARLADDIVARVAEGRKVSIGNT